MAEIKHLIETDYKGNYNNMGERIEAIEKEIHDSSYMTLTNENVRSFKVGTDSNGVSVALDSTNSAMGLEGQTLVNLIPENISLDDIEVKGSTVEILDDGYIKIEGNSNFQNVFHKPLDNVKSNGTYTLVFDVKECSLQPENNTSIFYLLSTSVGEMSQFETTITLSPKVGISTYKITCCANPEEKPYSLRTFLNQNAESGRLVYRLQLLEGDHTNKPIEYFEGLMSVGQSNDNKIEISSYGKNLLDITKFTQTKTQNGITVTITKDGTIKVTGKAIDTSTATGIYCYSHNTNELPYFPQGTYSSNYLSYGLDDITLFPIAKKSNGSWLANFNTTHTLREKFKINEILVHIPASQTNELNIEHKLFVYKDEKPTEYEPYQVNKTEILLNEPLRSVPNGVKDTMEIKDGKLIVTRRNKEVLLNGSENWSIQTVDNPNVISVYIPFDDKGFGDRRGVLCDKFKVANAGTSNLTDSNCCNSNTTGVNFIVDVSTTIATNVTEWKTWLTNNPMTLIYQLTTPFTEEYDLLNPILYKDGHVFLETGAIPCSSVSHEVALNTKAQVKNNSKAIASSRNIYDEMLGEYDGMLLELDYDHTVFDFEYNISKLKLEEV